MTMNDYIVFFSDTVRKSLSPGVAEDVIAIIDSRSPRIIFETLERLRVQGTINDKKFENMLTDFYWQFC